MFINFGFEEVKTDTYKIEIKIGNEIKWQEMTTTPAIAQMQFTQLLEQSVNSSQPIKLKISKNEEIWMQSEQRLKNLTNFIQFANKAYIAAFPQEFKEDI